MTFYHDIKLHCATYFQLWKNISFNHNFLSVYWFDNRNREISWNSMWTVRSDILRTENIITVKVPQKAHSSFQPYLPKHCFDHSTTLCCNTPLREQQTAEPIIFVHDYTPAYDITRVKPITSATSALKITYLHTVCSSTLTCRLCWQ